MSAAPPAVAAVATPRARAGLLARLPAVAPLGVLCVALALAIAPAWSPVWYQDDQLPTLFRTFHTDLAHHWGILYPRLAAELGFGYGRLLHEFYPPFAVELAAWLHTLGLGFVDAARATFSLCLLSSGLGMYAFGRAVLGGRWPALVAAVGFVWAPYVLLDAHKGGVLGESIALALMPWSLLALDRQVRGGGWTAFGASAGLLALVVLGHNITALFFVGLASAYAALVAAQQWVEAGSSERRVAVWRLVGAAGAVLLALALAAIYWLPALVELSLSRVSEQRTGDFTVTRYLVAPPDLLQPALVFDYYVEAVPRYGLMAGLLTLAALGLVGLACLRRDALPGLPWSPCIPTAPDPSPLRGRGEHGMRLPLSRGREGGSGGEGIPRRLVVGAFGVCFLVVLLLQLRVTATVWDTLPLISFVQFPQRLFVFGAFAGAVVLGSAPEAVARLTGSRRLAICAGIILVGLLGLTSLPGIYWTWPVAGSHVLDEDQVGIGTVAERRLSERRAFDDYFPISVEEDAAQITRPASASRAELYRAASAGPAPRVEIVERGYLGMVLRTTAEAPSTLVLHQFYFPGWQADADGTALAVGPVGPLGLVSVTIPPGQHLVRVWFGDTPIRLAAAGVSVAALVALLLVLARGLGVRRLLIGLGLMLVIVGGPRLLHDRLSPPDERPAARIVNVEVTPAARVAALELAERPARPGELLPVTLIWQAADYSPRDLQTGLRLVTVSDGRVVSERWGRPNRERTPTNKWLVGELVPDTLLLRIPNETRPGRYRLQAGLRDPDAGGRAPLGLAEIGEIEIR